MKIFKIYITVFFCLSIFSVSANTHAPTNKKSDGIITAKEHSIIAPEGTRYQWYLNNIQIEGATERELAVSSSGFYKVELTAFNGEVIEKNTIVGLTAAGAIIRIFTIGDSTVQDYTAGYYPRKGWGQVLPIFFNTANVSVINKAVGGTSSKSFYNSFWPAVRNGLQAGDFVFIQFGINDRNNADTARYAPTGGVFEGYLTKFVNETRAKGAYPVLVATLRRNAWNANGTVYDAYHDHPVATRTVAASLGVPLIDLDAKAKVLMESVGQQYCTRLLYNTYLPGEYPNYPNGNIDPVHFQEMGAIEMAKLVSQGIRDLSADPNVKKLIPFLKPEYQIAVYVNPVGSDSVTTHTTTYPQGLTITLKTIPKKTGTFQRWNNAAGTQLSTATQTTVTSGTTAISYTAMYTGAAACIASITSSTAATFCAGGSIVLTANAGSSYRWLNGTTQVGTASTYTATAAGNYTVEVTNAAGCKATSAVKTITVNPLPVITQYVQIGTGAWTAAATAAVCEGNTVNLGPQPTAATGWSWTGPNNFTSTLRNPVLANVLVANAGNYVATYTDANGCKATSTFALQVTKPIATIATPNTTIIPYKGSITLNATTGSGYTYQWKNNNTNISGATTASYTATTAGSYTVMVTASTCSATSAAVVLTLAPTPLKYIYTYDNSGNLSWTNTNSWTPKTVPTAIDTVIIRTGEVQIANLNHTAPVYVETNGILRLVDTSTVANLHLQGGTLKAYTSAPGMMLTSNITVEQPSTIMAGSVAATIFTLNGTITGNANLTKTSVGILRINSTAAGFKGNWIVSDGKLQLQSASGLGVCGVQVKATGRLDIAVAGASIYSLVIETGGGVDLNQSLATSVAVFGTENIVSGAYKNATYPTFIGSTGTLNVSNSLVTASGPTTFCQGSSVTLTASSGASYIWKNTTTQVGTAAAYTANTSGSYTVDATSAAGCKVSSAPLATVGSIATIPTITATATSFCPGGSAILTASAGSSYKWFNGTTQVGTASTYTATAAGAYTVELTNAAGCKATSVATTITINTIPTASITAPTTSFCSGGSVTLTASTGTLYKWFNGTTQVGTSSAYTATTAGTYTVEITNASGCKATSNATSIAVTATITWYADTDNDGVGDLTTTINACTKPNGYVSTAGDACPTDANKTAAGACGCGNLETDTDSDGIPNCVDSDDDNDGVADASDCAPLNAAIGAQTIWYQDTDGDGKGSASSTLTSCTQPSGYVAIAGDDCPTDANKILAGNCGCGNTETSCLDCAGTPHGTAFLDNCNICIGGTTGNTACVPTPTATINGTSATITVVPQPFDASTIITVENYGAIQSYTIISASGALVETRQGLHTTEITLGESIASGLYTVIISTEQGTYTTKILKK